MNAVVLSRLMFVVYAIVTITLDLKLFTFEFANSHFALAIIAGFFLNALFFMASAHQKIKTVAVSIAGGSIFLVLSILSAFDILPFYCVFPFYSLSVAFIFTKSWTGIEECGVHATMSIGILLGCCVLYFMSSYAILLLAGVIALIGVCFHISDFNLSVPISCYVIAGIIVALYLIGLYVDPVIMRNISLGIVGLVGVLFLIFGFIALSEYENGWAIFLFILAGVIAVFFALSFFGFLDTFQTVEEFFKSYGSVTQDLRSTANSFSEKFAFGLFLIGVFCIALLYPSENSSPAYFYIMLLVISLAHSAFVNIAYVDIAGDQKKTPIETPIVEKQISSSSESISSIAFSSSEYSSSSGQSSSSLSKSSSSLESSSSIDVGVEKFVDLRDGKTYSVIKIGKTKWLSENLRYASKSSLCYANRMANCEEYGRLYKKSDAYKVCPKGWRLPRRNDFKNVEKVCSKKGVALGTCIWQSNQSDKNLSGLSVLKAGKFNSHNSSYEGVGKSAYFWMDSRQKKSKIIVFKANSYSLVEETVNFNDAFSVRCVQ